MYYGARVLLLYLSNTVCCPPRRFGRSVLLRWTPHLLIIYLTSDRTYSVLAPPPPPPPACTGVCHRHGRMCLVWTPRTRHNCHNLSQSKKTPTHICFHLQILPNDPFLFKPNRLSVGRSGCGAFSSRGLGDMLRNDRRLDSPCTTLTRGVTQPLLLVILVLIKVDRFINQEASCAIKTADIMCFKVRLKWSPKMRGHIAAPSCGVSHCKTMTTLMLLTLWIYQDKPDGHCCRCPGRLPDLFLRIYCPNDNQIEWCMTLN